MRAPLAVLCRQATPNTPSVQKGVLVTSVQHAFGGTTPSTGPSGVVAEFSCREVTETRRHLASERERGVSFSLAGPLGVLKPRELPTNSWTGDRTVKTLQSDLDLGVAWYGPIELRNSYLWKRDGGSGQGRYTAIPTLHLSCEAPEEDLTDDDLLTQAKQLADDATLLMSVAARRWVVWYQYSLWTPRIETAGRGRSSRDTSGRRHSLQDSPVGLRAREFLKTCLTQFRERRSSGLDLRLPIAYWVPKAESRYVEERFAAAFWALEKLLELFVIDAV